MVSKKITRTLTKSTINGYTVEMVEGKPTVKPLNPVTAWGNLTDKEAEKVLVEEYGKEAKPIVGEVTVTEETYSIPVTAFVLHGEKVEKTDSI